MEPELGPDTASSYLNQRKPANKLCYRKGFLEQLDPLLFNLTQAVIVQHNASHQGDMSARALPPVQQIQELDPIHIRHIEIGDDDVGAGPLRGIVGTGIVGTDPSSNRQTMRRIRRCVDVFQTGNMAGSLEGKPCLKKYYLRRNHGLHGPYCSKQLVGRA